MSNLDPASVSLETGLKQLLSFCAVKYFTASLNKAINQLILGAFLRFGLYGMTL